MARKQRFSWLNPSIRCTRWVPRKNTPGVLRGVRGYRGKDRVFITHTNFSHKTQKAQTFLMPNYSPQVDDLNAI